MRWVFPTMSYWPEHWQWLKNWLQLDGGNWRTKELLEASATNDYGGQLDSKERRKFNPGSQKILEKVSQPLSKEASQVCWRINSQVVSKVASLWF